MKKIVTILISLFLISACAGTPEPINTTPAGNKTFADITPLIANENQISINVHRYYEILSLKNDQSMESAIKEGVMYAEEHCKKYDKKAILSQRNDETPAVYSGHSGGVYETNLTFDCK